MKSKLTTLAIAAVLGIGAGQAGAQTAYGWQLMDPQERAAHRAAVQTLPYAEREAYRTQHHEQMKQRAAAKGLTLPDRPLVAGGGRRNGAGAFGPGNGFRGRGGRCCR